MGSSLSQYWRDSKQAQGGREDCDAAAPSSGHAFQGAENVLVNDSNVNTAGRDINTTINNFHGPHDSDLVSKIQEWLAPHVNYRNIQIDTFNKRAPDTGTWLLESEKFKQWLESENGLLWGIGIPGAGKTVLASTVIDHLQRLSEKSGKGKISVAFAYCRYTDALPVRVILAALLRQLLEDHQELVAPIEPLYVKHKRHKTQPTQRELLDLLIKISSMFAAIFFVLDGLDEAPHDDQFDLITILASVKVHFIITSRPLKNLEKVLPDVVFFEIVAQKEDIRVHVTQRISQMPEVGRLLDRHGVKEEIISTICENAEGMFLHAILQVEALRRCLTLKKIREALKGLPAKNEEMYLVTLNRIRAQLPEHASLALKILVWLVFAHRSLSVEDLQWAVSMCQETRTFDPEDIIDEELLVSVCCGLVTVDVESRIVRLIHFTAKDALEPALLVDFPDPHGLLAPTCISRLVGCQFHESHFETERELDQAFRNTPFLEYSYDAWYIHVKKSMLSPSMVQDISTFLGSCNSFPINTSMTDDHGDLDYANSIHLAALYDLVEFLDISHGCNTPTPRHMWTPLILGSLGFVVSPEHSSSRSAMLLLECPGIEVNATVEGGHTALMMSGLSGNENIVQRLLEFSDIEVNGEDANGRTPLMWASASASEGAVKLLLGHLGVDINKADKEGCTALMMASTKGHDGVVKLLLGHPGVEVNHGDSEGTTALMSASQDGHSGVVKLLLGHSEVEVNQPDSEGKTALILASHGGHDDVVKLLLGHPRIEVNQADSEGRTALIWAAQYSMPMTVKALLGCPGIQVDKQDHMGHTAIYYALGSGWGHRTIVRCIRDHDPVSHSSRTN